MAGRRGVGGLSGARCAVLSAFVLAILAAVVAASLSPAPPASASAAPSASATASPAPAASPSFTLAATPAATPIAVQAPVAPPGPGADIFAANCSGCHGVAGQGGVAVPSLPFPPPPLAPAGFASLVAPMVRQGGIQMPSFARQLTSAQIDLVAQYVSQEIADPAARTANASDGGQIFRLYCAGCHSTTGRGGAMARGRNAPDIAQYPAAEALAAMILGRGNMPVFAGHALDVRQQTAVALYVDVLVARPIAGRRRARLPRPGPRGRGRRRRSAHPHRHRRLAGLEVAEVRAVSPDPRQTSGAPGPAGHGPRGPGWVPTWPATVGLAHHARRRHRLRGVLHQGRQHAVARRLPGGGAARHRPGARLLGARPGRRRSHHRPVPGAARGRARGAPRSATCWTTACR